MNVQTDISPLTIYFNVKIVYPDAKPVIILHSVILANLQTQPVILINVYVPMATTMTELMIIAKVYNFIIVIIILIYYYI